MANRFEQSAPPSIHDVYRSLPIGPGGVEPFIFRDRGRHLRAPARLPWRRLILACERARRGLLGLWHRLRSRPSGRRVHAPVGIRPWPDGCGWSNGP